MGEHFLHYGNYGGAFHLHVLETEKVDHINLILNNISERTAGELNIKQTQGILQRATFGLNPLYQRIIIINNYSPKWRWIVVDICRAAAAR